ncbi:hypothetical protein JRX38_03680 [Gluconobacter cerinus]|uniref:hypothetical protein n=1 Tax=Gluconobacter cerinus TaxID=38307 RepID=UPI00193FA858|nr:hypothetical protein [Gluconobacter cerinus]MBM3097123.1 hypothetical protein [Gluconobacter cerinus]
MKNAFLIACAEGVGALECKKNGWFGVDMATVMRKLVSPNSCSALPRYERSIGHHDMLIVKYKMP